MQASHEPGRVTVEQFERYWAACSARSMRTHRTNLGSSDRVDGFDVLPGLQVSVAELLTPAGY